MVIHGYAVKGAGPEPRVEIVASMGKQLTGADTGTILVKMTTRTTTCGRCQAVLNEVPELPVEQRNPSPCCDTLARQINVEVGDTLHVGLRDWLRLRVKQPGRSGWGLEHIVGNELWRDRATWVEKVRRIDKVNDHYYERVTRLDTGAVVHERPPGRLTDHQGFGDAKKSKK